MGLNVYLYTLTEQFKEVPRGVWDPAHAADLVLLHERIPAIHFGPFKEHAGELIVVRRSELEHEAKYKLKESLLRALSDGEMDLDVAQTAAVNAGFRSLEENPDPASFDPMTETYWSLPMAIAWVATQNVDEVRQQWDLYVLRYRFFQFKKWQVPGGPQKQGYLLENCEPPSANFTFDEKSAQAKAALFTALSEGSLIATGLPEQGGFRVQIPREQWQDLRAFENGNREVFRYAFGASGYEQVTVERASLTGLFPSQKNTAEEEITIQEINQVAQNEPAILIVKDKAALKALFADFVARFVAAGTRASVEEQEKFLLSYNPKLKRRGLREYRAAIPKEWKKGGRWR